jgi:long-chain fatty acid transport protein
VAWCSAILACAAPLAARAQGFQLNEIGTCAVGRGQATTAATCNDPSVIYWNPAAATALPGWNAYLGVAAIKVGGEFTADTTGRIDRGDVPVEWPPHLFVSYAPTSGKWAAGVGVYVPYGLTSQWKTDFPGRFSAQKASLATLYIQPNIAFQFAPGWSIGGGPIIGHSSVELRQALDLAGNHVPGTPFTFAQFGIPARTEFALFQAKGSATAFGFNVGVHGQLTPDWQVGARYLSQLDFKYDHADATFAPTTTGLTLPADNPLSLPAGTSVDGLLAPLFATGGTLAPQKVSTRIKHPAQFQVGLGYSGLLNTILSADFEWTNFSAFDRLPVTFESPTGPPSRELIEDFHNSWSIRAGVEHAFAIGIKGRAGFTYVSTPAPDVTVTPLLPDMNRRNYSVGVGVPLSPRYSLDAAYLRVDASGRRGRIVERTSVDQTAAQLNSGFYSLNANVFSLSLRATF